MGDKDERWTNKLLKSSWFARNQDIQVDFVNILKGANTNEQMDQPPFFFAKSRFLIRLLW